MGKIFKTYDAIDMSKEIGRKKFFGAITHYLQAPNTVHAKLLKAGVTEFSNTDDFSAEVKVLIEKYHLGLEEIDSGYEQFFDIRNFAGVRAPGFRIREVSSGLSFTQRPEGGRAKIYSITGTEAYVAFDTYGGGLEFDQAWFDDQEWWLVEDSAAEFRSAWYRDKATIFYTLIGAITSGYNVAYDTAGSTQLDKDITTLNDAAAALLTALKTAGYAVSPSTALRVLSPIQLRGRLQRALAAQYITPATAGANLKVEYNIAPVYSMNVLNAGASCTDKWYMGVPGLKNKIGEKMPLTVFTNFKPEAYVSTAVGWGRFAGYLNMAQWRRISTS